MLEQILNKVIADRLGGSHRCISPLPFTASLHGAFLFSFDPLGISGTEDTNRHLGYTTRFNNCKPLSHHLFEHSLLINLRSFIYSKAAAGNSVPELSRISTTDGSETIHVYLVK